MDSKTLHTSDPPHQRDNDLTMSRLMDACRGRIKQRDDAWSRHCQTGPSGAFGRYQEIVRHGVLLEEDGWGREEEEWTMRHEEDEEDAKSRKRRGGTTMGEPCAQGCQEERAAARDAWEFGMQGARRGDNYASIQNIVKNIIQCQDFPLTC
jgi:hypothetical protein